MATLLITPGVLAEIDRIKTLALASPLDMVKLAETIRWPKTKAAHMEQMTRQTVDIPVGYVAVFSIEIHPPRGLARHLSVSVDRPGKLPSMEAAWMIAEAFGFTGSLQECAVWLEDLQRDDQRQMVPNIVQFIQADVTGHA